MRKRRFGRFRRGFKKSSPADVQTLSLCNEPIAVAPAPGTPFTCANPLIRITPILSGAGSFTTVVDPTPVVTLGRGTRGVSFKGARYKYMYRAGNNFDATQSSYVAQIYMFWVKMQVDTANPLTPLFAPNLIIGNPGQGAGNSPIGDPTVDVLHRDITEVVSPYLFGCTEACPDAVAVSNVYGPRDNLDVLSHDYQHSYSMASVRSKRFLKENETLFFIEQIVAQDIVAPNHFTINHSLLGHLALKVHW